MSEKIIYLIEGNYRGAVMWCCDPAPTKRHDTEKAIKYIRDDGEIKQLFSVIKDCLSYADAMAVLKQGEAVELRDKCRDIIEKVEGNRD